MDPAYLAQMQLQMHATGAPIGYLVSYARNELKVHEVPYRLSFVAAAAAVLVHVVQDFIAVEELPTLPKDARYLGFDKEVKALYSELQLVAKSCRERSVCKGVSLRAVETPHRTFTLTKHNSQVALHTCCSCCMHCHE